eukprot:gnl/MRDRNA2_/MRDRNA2_188250_c0_seq1.p1 gnl/MRDRNA2_/MRDRNA2_188250_c0~~gnl/MRDRNA2_/MRDRNA2_188250_c0_seq1.p1  ORF type:complete len:299 (-),score=78.10 gnl/MRDRNA2_/MRDRNA2_188250_c0_seq1:322-1218(-)
MEDEARQSELEKAAFAGDLEELKQLVAGGDFDTQSEAAVCALQAATETCQWDIVQYLIKEAGVNLRTEDVGGMVLQHASLAGRLDIVQLVVKFGVDLKSKAGSVVMLSAAATCQLDILRYIIEKRADVVVHGGEAALGAAKHGVWEAVRDLVVAGADLMPDGIGVQIVVLAAVKQQVDIVQLLQGKNVSVSSAGGVMALTGFSSFQDWDRDAVKYLIAHGVDVKSEGGKAALVTAAKYGDLEIVQSLVESGIDVRSPTGSEALGNAQCRCGAQAVEEYLTAHGAVPPPTSPFVMDEDF